MVKPYGFYLYRHYVTLWSKVEKKLRLIISLLQTNLRTKHVRQMFAYLESAIGFI